MPNIIFRFIALVHAFVITVSLSLLAVGFISGWRPHISELVGFAWLFDKTPEARSCQVKMVGAGGHATWMPCAEFEKQKNSYCETTTWPGATRR
jgi:hypothetical protein